MIDEEQAYSPPKVNLWAVHSAKDNQPVLRGWAENETSARELLGRLKGRDAVADDEYWIEQMTRHDFGVYKALGIIPEEINV